MKNTKIERTIKEKELKEKLYKAYSQGACPVTLFRQQSYYANFLDFTDWLGIFVRGEKK